MVDHARFQGRFISLDIDHHRLIFKGPFMYDQMIRVPFLARVPERFGGIGARRVADYDVSGVDLVPTLREYAGLEAVETEGLSLRPILSGDTSAPKRARRDDADHYIYGLHATTFALRNPARDVRAVWATENAERKLSEALATRALHVERATPRDLDRRVGALVNDITPDYSTFKKFL